MIMTLFQSENTPLNWIARKTLSNSRLCAGYHDNSAAAAPGSFVGVADEFVSITDGDHVVINTCILPITVAIVVSNAAAEFVS